MTKLMITIKDCQLVGIMNMSTLSTKFIHPKNTI